MPILPDQPETIPADLFEAGRPADALRWYVAHTRPRQEKALARELERLQLPFYLPCQRKRTRVGGSVVMVARPMFPGYVFVRTIEPEKWRINATKRVASLLNVADQDRLWSDLRRVRGVLDLGRPITPVLKLEPGTPVTLRAGPLAGMSGTIISRANGFTFVVKVDFIQQGIGVTVDGEWIGIAG